MNNFTNDVIKALDINHDGKHRYYVYGLIDPFTFQTFYVGKGCENRVFQHAKNAIVTMEADEDALSLKISTIQSIIKRHKNVIPVIYRWGLTNEAALLIESTLIDVLPGLTNIQRGYDIDHGMISAEDLQNALQCTDYVEPLQDYIIIKTKEQVINARGSLYDAVRGCWKNSLSHAQQYRYVLAVVRGVAQEVYEVDNWHISATEAPRIEFDGKPTTNQIMRRLVGHLIPEKLRKRGVRKPFLYCNGK